MDELFDITLADKDDEWLCAHKVIMAAICYPFTERKSHLLAKIMLKKSNLGCTLGIPGVLR